MTAVLLWKEYRQQRAVWLAFTLLAISIVAIAVFMGQARIGSQYQRDEIRAFMFAALLVMATAYGVVAGASLLAGEKEDGTQAFLDRLHGHREPVFVRKLLAGVLLTQAQSIVLMAAAWGLGWSARWEMSMCVPFLSMHGLICGLLAGAIWPTALAAVFCGLSFLVANALAAGGLGIIIGWPVRRGDLAPEFYVLANVPTNIAGLYATWRIYCKRDFLRRRATSPGFLRHSWLFLVPAPSSLTWLVFRQGRWLIVGALVSSLVSGFVVQMLPLVIWPAGTLLLGIVCGLAVFTPDGNAGCRFFGAQRLPPTKIWITKIALWGLVCLWCVAVVWLIAAERSPWSGSDFLTRANPNTWIVNPSHSNQELSGNPFLLLMIWPLYGFCFGQFFGLCARWDLSARFLALVVSPVAVALWIPSLFFGGVPAWWVLSVPIILLLATRLLMWPWVSGRLSSAGPRGSILGFVALIVLSTGSFLGYRVLEVPDVGEPFDVPAFIAALDAAKKNEAGPLMRRAKASLQKHGQIVDKEFPRVNPRKERNWAPAPPGGDWSTLLGIMEDGWPVDDEDIGPWLDRLFDGEWVKDAEMAARLPLGLVFDPRLPKRASADDAWSYRAFAELFAAKALQLQAKGDSRGALDQLETTLGLSRQIMNLAPLEYYRAGLSMEGIALTAFHTWQEKAGPDKELLRRGLTVLKQHVAASPAPADAVKLEYLIYLHDKIQPPTNDDPVPMLFLAAYQVPWEKERQRRITDAAFFRQIEDLQKPNWTLLDWMRRRKSEPPPRPSWIQTPWSMVNDVFIKWVSARQQRLDGTQIVTALALYYADHGSLPAELQDLKRAYLAAVPVNRFDGKPFGYRIATEEVIQIGRYPQVVTPGQAVISGLRDGGTFVELGPTWAK